MKKYFMLCLLVFTLCACGASDPFLRGPQQKSGSDSPPAAAKPTKPVDEGKPEQPDSDPENPPIPSLGLDAGEFERSVLPLLERKCGLCHGNPAPHFERAKAMVVFQKPEQSDLYLYSTGANGRHRAIFRPNTPEDLTLKNWILGVHE